MGPLSRVKKRLRFNECGTEILPGLIDLLVTFEFVFVRLGSHHRGAAFFGHVHRHRDGARNGLALDAHRARVDDALAGSLDRRFTDLYFDAFGQRLEALLDVVHHLPGRRTVGRIREVERDDRVACAVFDLRDARQRLELHRAGRQRILAVAFPHVASLSLFADEIPYATVPLHDLAIGHRIGIERLRNHRAHFSGHRCQYGIDKVIVAMHVARLAVRLHVHRELASGQQLAHGIDGGLAVARHVDGLDRGLYLIAGGRFLVLRVRNAVADVLALRHIVTDALELGDGTGLQVLVALETVRRSELEFDG